MVAAAVSSALVSLTQIIQSAAQASSIGDQVNLILDRISDSLAVDVCSLYQVQADGSVYLVASHGLVQTHPIVIPAGQGLVGQVLSLRHSINIVDPAQHPKYFYVPNSKEEDFRSFCGIPLIFRGRPNGVLVAQRRVSQAMDSDEEAVLSTLAVHLAVLLESFTVHQISTVAAENIVARGVSGAPGLALGVAVVQSLPYLVQAQRKAIEDVDSEVQRWQQLKNEAVAEFEREREIIRAEMSEGLAAVLDAYQMMLEDPTFGQMVRDEILKGEHLPWALRQTVEFFSKQFKAMGDAYLQARHEDVEHLGDKLYQMLLGQTQPDLQQQDAALILVGDRISVSTIANLSTQNLVGIVCFEGAALSHIAVFANALGIPAVMGVPDLKVNNGERLVVDGDRAEVITLPSLTLWEEYHRLMIERRMLTAKLLENATLPARTTDGERITLMANSGLQADVEPGLRYGAEGIGLYRTEIPFMVSSSLPSEGEQVKLYRHVIERYQGKPVYMRTLDVGSDKPLPYMPIVAEENPALGLRGIRYTLDNPSLLSTQLRAILKAAEGRDELHLLLPMVSTTPQLDATIAIIDETVQELRDEGINVQRPKIGVMVEVPSSIALLPFWRDKIDFASIGTNDLSQYLLAVDRNNSHVSEWFESLNPAVLHELARIMNMASQMQLPVSVCGEMASDPIAVVLLMGLGGRKFSMSAAKIPLIKSLINEISMNQAQELAQQVLAMDNAAAIRAVGVAFLQERWSLHGTLAR